MYLRFVTERRNELDNRREGFFQAAYAVRRAPQTPEYAVDRLDELLGWFHDTLDEPDRFSRSRTGVERALSWFRAEARDHIAYAYDIAAVLQEHGVPVTVLKTRRPGFVVYEDDIQIVAEPFADTPT